MKKLWRLSIILAVTGVLMGLFWVTKEWRAFLERPLRVKQEGVQIIIPRGMTVYALASELAQQEIVRHPYFLVWLARWEGKARHIKAGEYHIKPGMTPSQFLDQIVDGKVVHYALTIVEGWSFRQLMDSVRADTRLEHRLDRLSDGEIMERLGYLGQHPEGQFYPDTYHYVRGTTDLEYLQRAYRTMERRLKAEWQTRVPDLPYKSAYEALIMASVIEKETAIPEERSKIAGVMVRRLKLGMRLQADPTVIYGLGQTFDGNLRRRDLKADTPYNTYRRSGLPPTPIAMPGGDAIHAALHPAPGNYLYFVAKGDGSHYFSTTLKEHNRAVRRYQLKPHYLLSSQREVDQ